MLVKLTRPSYQSWLPGMANSSGAAPGQLSFPLGVAVSLGEVYVSDSSNSRINVYGTDGTFSRSFGTNGSAAGQLSFPFGVAVSGLYGVQGIGVLGAGAAAEGLSAGSVVALVGGLGLLAVVPPLVGYGRTQGHVAAASPAGGRSRA